MLNKLKSIIVDRKLLGLSIVFGILLTTFIALFIYAISGGQYFISNEDETIYHNSAKLFYETSSVKSASCISEDVSPILQTAWYGPFYHLFYGGISKIFGYSYLNFLIINFVLILFSIAIIIKTKLSTNIKLITCISILSADTILKNVFTYFPETLHILFSIILILQLIGMSKEKLNRQYFWTYIILVLFFTLFRISTIFWLVGIIPFAKSRKHLFINFGIFLLGIILAMFYMKGFTASAYAEGLKSVDYLINMEILSFIKAVSYQFWENLVYLFTQPSISVFIVISLVLLTYYQAIRLKNNMLIATALICTIFLLALISLYTTGLFYFEKQTATLIPLLVVTNILERKSRLFIFILFISFIPYSLSNTISEINQHKNAYKSYIQNQEIVAAFLRVSELVDQTQESVVLWNFYEHQYPNNTLEAIIPLSNGNSNPILWTTNICYNIAPEEIKFQRHYKIQINYILSKFELHAKDISLIEKNKYYYFYRINY